jgi:hypothetical protein
VVQVEGLRSYKAVAFINRKINMRLSAKTYSELRMSLQRNTQILPEKITLCVEASLDIALTEKLGDEEWKK